jgi:universal stress protein A
MIYIASMMLPTCILVPTDFSGNAEHALDYAVELAAKLGAKVHLLNVIAMQMFGAEYGVAVTQAMVEDVMRGNQEALDRLVAARATKAAFGPAQLEFGDPRAVVEQTALKLGVDLIVMGTHGRHGMKRLLIGSVAESVVRTAPCPVLLIRDVQAP